jgi:hypothetical protein
MVCELEGPMPILKISNTLKVMENLREFATLGSYAAAPGFAAAEPSRGAAHCPVGARMHSELGVAGAIKFEGSIR